MTSTLIQHGMVFTDGTFEAADVLLENGRITRIGQAGDNADHVIDATGLYVAPGFIDLHCHIFNHPKSLVNRLNADRIGVHQGVACLVDTGSAGAGLIDEFKPHVIDTQQTAAFALCNIGSPGAPGSENGHAAHPDLIDLEGTVRAIQRHPDWILGVKVLASASHTGMLGIEAVKIARKAAEISGTPLMVHIGNAPPVVDEVLNLLRPGDIVTHTYHGKVGGILGFEDQVIPAFRAAVHRGVHVDIAHGRSSFSYDTCRKALDQGMPIHSISSDLHRGNVDRYVVSLARTMSKFRALGLPLPDVVQAVTGGPAKALGLDRFGFGSLQEGGKANITLFRETDREVEMEDAAGEVIKSEHWIEPVNVLVDGQIHDVSEPL